MLKYLPYVTVSELEEFHIALTHSNKSKIHDVWLRGRWIADCVDQQQHIFQQFCFFFNAHMLSITHFPKCESRIYLLHPSKDNISFRLKPKAWLCRMVWRIITAFHSSPSYHPYIPPTPGEDTHIFGQIVNFFEEEPEESPWLGFGPDAGTPPLKLRRREKGELGKLPLTGTQVRVGAVRLSRLLYILSTLFLPLLHLCVVHSAFFSSLHFYISLHLSAKFSFPSLSRSLPTHTACLVCSNGPQGWSWLLPTKYNEYDWFRSQKTGLDRGGGHCSPICECKIGGGVKLGWS